MSENVVAYSSTRGSKRVLLSYGVMPCSLVEVLLYKILTKMTWSLGIIEFFGICPSSGILKTEHNVSETVSVSETLCSRVLFFFFYNIRWTKSKNPVIPSVVELPYILEELAAPNPQPGRHGGKTCISVHDYSWKVKFARGFGWLVPNSWTWASVALGYA
jgi:hypothetical protein